ncbi:mRNA-degrading endonuclease RelE, toxin component of the RelBE toxin-antitoxin system [Mucilaginibacter pineti]|uniref:mRNA-degrading endonuclease RelE, toxin component of the RelBE toxin-antitoxin system n=1 Tax=Mucilaginibacter pineti TaxID=1391627 RepID=A0A1G7C289_9SPHI|nr:type II toxin-antitoxin system RelE/ParE family toxin [Mucilaginibacter pineti]SDE32545.1 mRNA-degrading endonuclease RelE, toxin component of the RelBE toxin-antitoxin system [Mucilaginibacter pineti]
MSYKILLTPSFERELKKLSKKYLSLKGDLSVLLTLLKEDPTTGKSLGNDCYKIRLAISSKNKGKSGGARVITYVKIVDEVIYLISIYDKSDTDSISDNEILSKMKLYK